jgi:2-polyprenyl-3-methyl-5-hydroxy-6-metoxy-1,4-benzoquinol methylase
MPPSAYQVADWNGQSGERWVAHQARLDARVAVFGQAAIEAATPATGERVLDIGCGAGAGGPDEGVSAGGLGE